MGSVGWLDLAPVGVKGKWHARSSSRTSRSAATKRPRPDMILAAFASPNWVQSWLAAAVVALLQLLMLFAVRHGRARQGAKVYPTLLWLCVTLLSILGGGVHSPGFGLYVWAILIAGLLSGRRAALLFAMLSTLSGLGLLYAEQQAILNSPLIAYTSSSWWAAQTIGFLGAAGVIFAIMRHPIPARWRARSDAGAATGDPPSLERQRFLERVLAAAPDAIVALDAGHRIVEWNPGAERLFGYKREEVIGRELDPLIASNQVLSEAVSITRQVSDQQDVGPITTVRYRKDGSAVHVLLSGSPIVANGVPVGAVGVYTDITERVRAEEELRRRTEELAVITRVSREIASVPDLQQVFGSIARHAAELSSADASGVFAFRPNGLLYIEAGYGVNEAFIQAVNGEGIPLGTGAIGRAAAEKCAIQIPDTVAMEDYAYGHLAALEEIRAILAAPMLSSSEVVGGIVLWHRQPRRFSTEEVAFLQALAQQCVNAIENARLFEAEARRRREAETLRAATQALSATLDLQNVFDLILMELEQVVPYDSASVQELLGEHLEIIGGRGFPNLEQLLGVRFDVNADDNPNCAVALTRSPVILDDAPTDYGEFHREPHSHAGIRSWLGVPLLFGDRLIGMLALDKREPGFYTQEHARLVLAFAAQAAIAIENARLYAVEEQRSIALTRALEKQRELDRLKDEFIQNVSHELRTPLGLIQGYAELIHGGDLGPLDPKQQEPISIIVRRARMLGKLVGNLTAILETETKKARYEVVDLSVLVNNLVVDFQYAAEQAGLALTAEVTPGLAPVRGDPTHLYRVFDNLLGNAVKFTEEGGCIDVRLRQERERLVLDVVDTGVGIPEDQLEQVFERFYQVDGSMSRRYGGAGLGLALVKEIVEAHGGRVSVESQVGQGSAFRVELPTYVEPEGA
jgi:PAS domain S-box-containing protein